MSKVSLKYLFAPIETYKFYLFIYLLLLATGLKSSSDKSSDQVLKHTVF